MTLHKSVLSTLFVMIEPGKSLSNIHRALILGETHLSMSLPLQIAGLIVSAYGKKRSRTLCHLVQLNLGLWLPERRFVMDGLGLEGVS